MDFKELVNRALVIRKKYSVLERKKYGKVWTKEQIAQGFVGDIGDLMKLVMAKDGVRKIDNADEKLSHEFSDCLWSIIILAHEYNIDLEESFMRTMNDIESYIVREMQEENNRL